MSRLCWPLAIWEQTAIWHAPTLFERHTRNVRITHVKRSGSRSRITGPTILLGLTHSLFSPQGQAWESACRSLVTDLMNGLRPQAPAERIQAQQPAGDAHGAGSDAGAAHQHGPAGEFVQFHCNDAPLSLLSLLEYNII